MGGSLRTIHGSELLPGMVLALPFNTTAVVTRVKVGRTFTNFTTKEFGNGRVGLHDEMEVLNDDAVKPDEKVKRFYLMTVDMTVDPNASDPTMMSVDTYDTIVNGVMAELAAEIERQAVLHYDLDLTAKVELRGNNTP